MFNRRSIPSRRKHRGRSIPSIKVSFSLMITISLSAWLTIFLLNLFFPFETWNPFEKTYTIGQKVIEEWKYGGVDRTGDLVFYNNFNTVSIPENKGRFDAAGDYILIHDHTADTLTIESKDDYIWKILMIGGCWLGGGLLVAVAAFRWITYFNRQGGSRLGPQFRYKRYKMPKPTKSRTQLSRTAYRKSITPKLQLPSFPSMFTRYRLLKLRWRFRQWQHKSRR